MPLRISWKFKHLSKINADSRRKVCVLQAFSCFHTDTICMPKGDHQVLWCLLKEQSHSHLELHQTIYIAKGRGGVQTWNGKVCVMATWTTFELCFGHPHHHSKCTATPPSPCLLVIASFCSHWPSRLEQTYFLSCSQAKQFSHCIFFS